VTLRAGNAPPSRRAYLAAATGALLLASLLVWRLLPDNSGGGAVDSLVTLPENSASQSAALRFAIPAAARAPMPASLAGTAVDGGFTLDRAGHFAPDKNALRLFEYFFSANGEESKDVLRGRILLHALAGGLSDSVVTEIAAVLDRYMAYRDAARATLASGAGEPTDLAARVAALRALQLQVLGPDLANAFYGDDAQLADIDMRRLAVLRDRTMRKEERQRAIDAIDAQLPPSVRDARKASTAPSSLHQRVEALRVSGGSATEIAALRRSEFGAGAAERLGMLDRTRAQWNARLAVYRGEEQKLRSAYGRNDSDTYRQALAALRQRHFRSEELARVRALDAEAR